MSLILIGARNEKYFVRQMDLIVSLSRNPINNEENRVILVVFEKPKKPSYSIRHTNYPNHICKMFDIIHIDEIGNDSIDVFLC